ncbi:MAG: hypothetical protein ABFS32_19065 [Bacteroidota bacterium]
MNLPEVLIHVSEKQNDSEKNELVEQLRNVDGVIAPRFSQESEHLLFVSYNSDTTNATALLDMVKQNGFKAQLVGL